MSITKQVRDRLGKMLLGSKSVPQGLFELSKYFIHFGPIEFDYKQDKDGYVAVSKNFKYGSIVTSAKDIKHLEENIKDAILTSFDIPSSYAVEAAIKKVSEEEKQYALT